jgi:CHAT domain
MKRILILSANPKNTSNLRLDEEIREIQASLKLAKNREHFEIVSAFAVRVDDLRRALLDHEPSIVHFSGHGSGSDGLVLENNLGKMQLVSTESLAKLFKQFETQVECVLLNACYSEIQAQAIHQHIDCVIGMNQKIGDKAAIKFATGFYDALGAGKTYEQCFYLGRASIDLEGISESETPQIKHRQRVSTLPIQPKEPPKNIEPKNIEPPANSGIYQAISGSPISGGGMIAAQGNNNQQKISANFGASPQEKKLTKEEAIQLLAQIEHLIKTSSELPETTKEKSLRYLGAAQEEAESHEPDKQLAAGNLKRMAESLKTASETVTSAKSLWENVKPILIQLSTWLGVAKSFFGF